MPRKGGTQSTNKNNQNEDSKSVTSHRSGSQARSQRNTKDPKSGRKGAKSRQPREASQSSAPKSTRALKEEVMSQQPKEELQSQSQSQVHATQKPPQMTRNMGNNKFPIQIGQGHLSQPVTKKMPLQPTNLPPQITPADVSRAHLAMPAETELMETEIAGEKVKASMKTIDYLKHFEDFLNDTPKAKLGFLNDKFFKKLPRDTGVFKTNRASEIRCPVCTKVASSKSTFEHHFNTTHKDLVQFGLKYINGEFKVSNKIVNLVAMFCFTHAPATQQIVSIVKDKVNDIKKMNEQEPDVDM